MSEERTASQVKVSLERNTAEFVRVKALEETIKAQMEEVKASILADMEDLGMEKYPTEEYTYSVTADSVTEKVDKKVLKEQYPNVFNQVVTFADRKGGLRAQKVKRDKKGE